MYIVRNILKLLVSKLTKRLYLTSGGTATPDGMRSLAEASLGHFLDTEGIESWNYFRMSDRLSGIAAFEIYTLMYLVNKLARFRSIVRCSGR